MDERDLQLEAVEYYWQMLPPLVKLQFALAASIIAYMTRVRWAYVINIAVAVVFFVIGIASDVPIIKFVFTAGGGIVIGGTALYYLLRRLL